MNYKKCNIETEDAGSMSAVTEVESETLANLHAVGELVVEGAQLDSDEFLLHIHTLPGRPRAVLNLAVKIKRRPDTDIPYLAFEIDEGLE